MDNDRYVKTFDADINPIKSKMQELGNFMKRMTASMKETWKGTFSGLFESVDIPDTAEELTSGIKSLEEQIGIIQRAYQLLWKEIGDKKPTQEQQQELTDLDNKYKQLSDRLELYRQKLKELKEEEKDNGEKGSSAFKGLIGAVKKYGLALLGIRSTFMIFRRAVSTAMQNNTELANKMNALWTGLGNAITPVLEMMVNAILKAFAYLSTFIKALSGGRVDLMASTAKGAKSTASSLKDAQKSLASFDELNNLDNGSSGGGSSGGFTNPFENMEMDTKWMELLEKFGTWMNEHWPSVVTLLGATWLWLEKIGAHGIWDKIYTLSTFLIGIGIAIGGVIMFFQDLNDVTDTWEAYLEDPSLENFYSFMGELGELIQDVALVIGGLGLAFGNTQMLMIAEILLLVGTIIQNVGAIKEYLSQKYEQIRDGWILMWQGMAQFLSGDWKTGVYNIFKGLFKMLDTIFGGIYDSAKLVWEGISDLFSGNWKDGLVKIARGIGNGVISIINGLIRGINAIAWPIRKLIVGIGSVLGYSWDIGSVSIPTVPYLDTGTNYVPSDQLAMIHKGEAVIPKKFNSQEYFGSNSEMIEKLDTLIEVVNNIDVNPYITIKDVGEASVKYQNQQYRLRGRSLVNG